MGHARLALVAILALAARPTPVRGDDERAPAAPRPLEPYALTRVEGDPDGSATIALARADALATSDPAAAARAFMALADLDPPARLPPRQAPWDFSPSSVEEGVLWPAREVALTRLAGLSAPGREAIEAVWGGPASRRLDDSFGLSTSIVALEDVAERRPVTRAGSLALRVLAEVALERGADAVAARRLWRWLRLRVEAEEPPERVAGVVARLAQALVRLRDERGIDALSRVALRVAGVPARWGGATAPIEDVLRRARDAVHRAIGATAAAPPARLPTSWVARWSLSLVDEGLVGEHRTSPRTPSARVAAHVAVDGERIYVVDARRVRALDRATGLVRWTYPDERLLRRDLDPAARSRPFELPVRDIVVARGLVLAVLGDPPIGLTGTFLHEGTPVHASHFARETRTRIVALDARDGRAVWWSGRLDETDPVVGAPDAAIASPLAIDDDAVLAVVSARRGWVESWLVAFELRSGRVRSTTYLGRAESGRVAARPDSERELEQARVRGLPRAQRPVRDGDEIAVVTGTGLVAGVDALTRRLRYVTALPRFVQLDEDGETDFSVSPFSPRNEPLAAFGAWCVGAEGAPYAVAIERGSGRLRWVATGSASPRDPDAGWPDAAHLVGTLADERGRGAFAFAGVERALEARDAVSGRVVADAGFARWAAERDFEPVAEIYDRVGGRPLRIDGSLVAVRGGALVAAEPDREGALAPWRERATPVAAREPYGGVGGDLIRAGDVWLVVEPEEIVAFSEPAARLAAAVDPGVDATDRAARACLDAIASPSSAALAAAVAAARSQPLVATQLLPRAVDAWLESPAGLDVTTTSAALAQAHAFLDALEPSARAPAYLKVFRLLEAHGADERVVEWLDAWLAFGRQARVSPDSDGRVEVRSDLYAAATLPRAAARSPAGRAALERREHRLAAALGAARSRSEPEFEEAVRRAGGSVVGWLARFEQLARRIDEGRYADAAAIAADLRTSAPWGVDPGAAAAHGLRGVEADCLARAGERALARAALFDADRDGPALARTIDGGPESLLAARLAARSGGPERGDTLEATLDLLPDSTPVSPEARRRVRALTPIGPGATDDLDRAILARGLDLEIAPLPSGARIGVTPLDVGWLGAVLQDHEPSLPGGGVRVSSTTAGSPADRAGIRGGDWLLRCGDRDVEGRFAFLRTIGDSTPATPLRLTGLRAGAAMTWTVVPGRRSIEDFAPVAPSRAWFAGDGTAVVATRAGLARVELATGRASPIWRSPAAGDIAEWTAHAGIAHPLAVTTPLGDTTVFAVDLATGSQRWSTGIEGAAATPPRVVGSALVVDTHDPDRTFLLDRADGVVRASWARADSIYPSAPGPERVARMPGSVDAGGALWLIRRGAEDSLWLTSIDPASGVARRHLRPAAGRPYASLRPATLCGGGVVAAAVASELLVALIPDLRGDVEPAGEIEVAGEKWGVQVAGGLDDTSRIAAGGDTIFVARISGSRIASLGAIEIDRRATRRAGSGDPVVWHPLDSLLEPIPSALRLERDVWPFIASLSASLDGAWACAAWFDGDGLIEGAPGRAVWYEPAHDDAFAPVATRNTILYANGPVVVGSRVLVPTDGGFLVVRRRPLDAH